LLAAPKFYVYLITAIQIVSRRGASERWRQEKAPRNRRG